MDCWHCRRTAVGTCRFCGRGVCEDHAQTQAYVLELFKGTGRTRALVVEDALFCGACTATAGPHRPARSSTGDARHDPRP